ncbi:MAG: hypothetical protein Q9218_002432 [Villophora microphyllina]
MAVEKTNKREGSTGDFNGDLDVNDNPPTRKELDNVADLPVLDAKGKSHTFKSLYTPPTNNERSRILIIFIRHFFCGNCQEYLRSLSSSLPPSALTTLDPPTKIIVIGCGQPDLIPMYIRETQCTYPIYADPTKQLYARLGMTRTLNLGNKSPQYMQYSLPSAMIRAIYQGLKAGRDAFKGGDYWQVGGEFIFEDVDGNGRPEITWCHRMKNTRDHAEVPDVRRRLDLDGARPPLRKTFTSGIRRSSSQLKQNLSDRRRSWGGSVSRSRDRAEKSSPEGSMMDKVKEDPHEKEAEKNSEGEKRNNITSGIRRSSSQLKRNFSDRRRSWGGSVSRSRDRAEKSSPEGSTMEDVKEDRKGEEAEMNSEDALKGLEGRKTNGAVPTNHNGALLMNGNGQAA